MGAARPGRAQSVRGGRYRRTRRTRRPRELTPQQRQIVRLASHGLTDREIGDRLFLSPRTVSSHLYRSYPKLGVASRHQLRDVIAPASTPPPAHESAESRTLL
jgi:DNA-binding CsgD family transcriptional regulator